MRIAQIMTANAWGTIDAESLDRGIGGREGAMIRLAREWAFLGHEVTNFVPTQYAARIQSSKGFYEFVPASMAATMLATFPYDAAIAWECPSIFANERILDLQKVRLVEMQCAHMVMSDIEASAELATGVVGLSQWHVDFMAHSGIEGPFYVLPNGVDLADYPWKKRKTVPKKPKFFYSSSPDRGLWHLFQMWPYIRQVWPEATLTVAYGLIPWLAQRMWSHRRDGQMAVEMTHMMNQDGITDVGKVGRRELAKIQRESNILAYPCDTIAPTETGCITVIEAMAAGCPVVTTDCDCLEEEFGGFAEIEPLPFRPLSYLQRINDVFADKERYLVMRDIGRDFAEGRQWRDIAPRWLDLFAEQARL